MGPMLSKQQEQHEINKNNIKNINNITNDNRNHEESQIWNADNHQSTITNNLYQRHEVNNNEDKTSNINNNSDQNLSDNNDHLSHTVIYSPMSSLSLKLLSFSLNNDNYPTQLSTNDGRKLTAMIEQQQQEPEDGQLVSLDSIPELLVDVKNNYTRRRKRGRLRPQSIINSEDPQITSIIDTTNDVIVTTTAENTINNNPAPTISLDNIDINIDEGQKTTLQLCFHIETVLNSFVRKIVALPLLLPLSLKMLLLFLGLKLNMLWKLSRYVYMNNSRNVLATNRKRRLPANTYNNSNNINNNNNNNYKSKLNYNNNEIVKNYVFLIGLCVATTILPLNLVNAASPFQNQKHNNHNNNNNNNNHNHHSAGSNGIIGTGTGATGLSSGSASSAVLTPSPSFPVSSAASSSETEFLYPSSQSEETFDDDDALLQYTISSNETDHDNFTIHKTPLFPTDLFTKEQLENGAVICHIIGVIYMFVALAIVCDEFFVPSLDVIIEKLGITDDVAGATFMAAGGSAPELFTSVIGVFVSFDDVGIGTIVGSAVFNILFVIGMCALFSKTVLSLTWWPLFRDCSFYSVSLLILIYFFRDNLIYWWEALVLFSIYMAYVGFMKWNQQVERCVKKVVTKNKVTRVRSTDQLMPAGNAANSSETSMATQPGGSVTSRAASETRSGPPGSSSGATGNSAGAGSTQTGAKFRHGLLQLMIHTIDPLHDDDVPGKVDEKATQLHAIASLKVLLDATKPQRSAATTSAANHVKINLKETTLADRPNGNIDTTLDSPSLNARRPSWIEQRVKIQTRRFSTKGNEVEDEPEALSMAWPPTARKRLTYVLVAPLLFPMWLTLPDTRTPRGKRFFPVTFIGSILWIAAYSYLMVWWANVAGDTARIPPEVMGLTFLAAGTSIPDLITSVIVARKGFGDMAVSSSVGSNIFDVTVGLPIPWLLYGIIYDQPVEVNSVGMVCSITILFMMLLFVILSIACFHWKMNRGLGFTMFLLYFVFVAVSLMFEYNIIVCPV